MSSNNKNGLDFSSEKHMSVSNISIDTTYYIFAVGYSTILNGTDHAYLINNYENVKLFLGSKVNNQQSRIGKFTTFSNFDGNNNTPMKSINDLCILIL